MKLPKIRKFKELSDRDKFWRVIDSIGILFILIVGIGVYLGRNDIDKSYQNVHIDTGEESTIPTEQENQDDALKNLNVEVISQ